MNQIPRHAAFLTGLAVVAWVGAGYLLANPLALAVSVLILALYLAGALELQRFRRATGELATAVDELDLAGVDPAAAPGSAQGDGSPVVLRAFLDRVPVRLRNAVRRRVEGEPAALPGPTLAPTLAGLLVLLGMLGTFLGMILTLRGTGAALETATDLVAVRNSLIAPVKGLGLAFGTSVAGVAASAALGLLAALARRERLAVAQRLDARIATTLRPFSVAHQREESLALLRRQADLMPTLVDGLKSLMATLATRADASQARLLASQERFQDRTEAAYAGLAASVERSLQASLAEGARIAGETLRPVAEATLAGIARETAALHAALAGTAQNQLEQLSARFERSGATVAASWQALLARQARAGDEFAATLAASHERFARTFEARSAAHVDGVAARLDGAAATFERHGAALLDTVRTAHAELQASSGARDQRRAEAMGRSLEVLAESLQRQWQQAGAQSLEQQQRVVAAMERSARDITVQAETQARATIAEIGRLVQAAAEAPRAAAEVIAELRQKLSDSMARDNTLLDERARILETLGALLAGVNQAAGEQRGAIDALVAASAEALERVGARFDEHVRAGTGKLADVAAQVTGGAADVARLGQAFGAAVHSFGEAGDRLGTHLERIDGALGAQMARSDEQLAYYVAQAREVIDLSILSQKQIIEELQRLAGRQAAEALA